MEKVEKQINKSGNVKGWHYILEKPPRRKFHALDVIREEIDEVTFPEILQCMLTNPSNLKVDKW